MPRAVLLFRWHRTSRLWRRLILTSFRFTSSWDSTGEGVKVANKTGELDDVENDAGIIYSTAKGIDLAVCFMSQDLTDSGAAQASIAQDARLIYGYYNE